MPDSDRARGREFAQRGHDDGVEGEGGSSKDANGSHGDDLANEERV